MRKMVLLTLALGACAPSVPITSNEFVSHGRFQADERERALAQCRYEAGGRGEAASAAETARGRYIVAAFDGMTARKNALQQCMEAKGYRWTSPRFGD